MRLFDFRFRAVRILSQRRTVFLLCLLLGLVASSWDTKPEPRAYATNVYLNPIYNSWEEYEGVRVPRRNCGILRVKLDEVGRVTLNNEPQGTIDDLSDLRERLNQIIEERRQKVMILDLGPDGEKKFGYRIVNAEFEVLPPDSAKYGDFVRLVDLAASFAPSVVYVETPSSAKDSEVEFQRWAL